MENSDLKINYVKFNIVVSILCLITLNITAQCPTSVIVNDIYNQSFHTYADTTGNSIRIIKFDLGVLKVKNMTFINENSDSLTIRLYSSNPCDSPNDYTKEYISAQKLIEISGKEEYKFIKVITKGIFGKAFSIKLSFDQQYEKCVANENRFNKMANPTDMGMLSTGSNCYSVCNTNCKEVDVKAFKQHIEPNVKVRWLQFDCQGQMIIEPVISGLDDRMVLYGKSGEHYHRINTDAKEVDGRRIYDLSEYSQLVVGLYKQGLKEGDISLCIYKYAYSNSCVNFFGTGQTVKAVYTSKGSPTSGPFLMGEEVTYEYKLKDWMPIANNWIHGLSFSMGKGWKGLKYDTLKNEYIVSFQDQKAHRMDSINAGFGFEWVLTDTVRGNGTESIKSLITPGFYTDSEALGPSGPSYNYRWGREFDGYTSHIDTPFIKLYFTLVADSSLQCDGPLDGNFAIRPLSDYETGRYDRLGCVDEKPLLFESQINCCEEVVQNRNRDTMICGGGLFDFSKLNCATCSYYKEQDYKNLRSRGEQPQSLTSLQLSSAFDTISIISINSVVSPCDKGENKWRIFTKPDNQRKDIPINDACNNEPINLSTILLSINANADLRNYQSSSSTTIDDKGNVWLLENNESIVHFVNTITKNCPDSISFIIDKTDCADISSTSDSTETDQSITAFLRPNPALYRTEFVVQNNTNSETWMLKLIDAKNNLITQETIQLPHQSIVTVPYDISYFQPGIYYIILTDGKSVIAKSFIKLQN